MNNQPTIVWFRRDLRVTDNPALHFAAERDCPVIPIFIAASEESYEWGPGAASKWWLHQSLVGLKDTLATLGADLIIRSGDEEQILRDLINSTDADTVCWNQRYEPELSVRDRALEKTLLETGVVVKTFHERLLFEPGSILSQAGTPYKVFTPFWKKCLDIHELEPPLPAPSSLLPVAESLTSLKVDSLNLLPDHEWINGLDTNWDPGEKAAESQLLTFLDDAVVGYPDDRDIPSIRGTSRLSPYLHFGEISPRQIFYQVRSSVEQSHSESRDAAESFLRQIGWREFSYHMLAAFPETSHKPLYEKFEYFQWVDDRHRLELWQKGQTGFPLVDAGMRELWATGWMHNRVRMVVASFLIKDLLIHWLEGARWFWDTLVDADLANNTMGWQWCAGSGADASPFFRIFNPVSQSKKFDKKGEYIRKWIPELSNHTDARIHEPWKLTPEEKAAASSNGIVYPDPIVDHAEARRKALEIYKEIK